MEDLLMEQIESLQKEYLNLLKSVETKITTKTYPAIMDEILLFWKKRKNIVYKIIEYHFEPWKAFVFTGATFLDVDDYEYLPFLAFGEKHIMDDPLCTYLEMSAHQTNQIISLDIAEQVMLTLSDNIKIINQCFPHIIILPIRYLMNAEKEIRESIIKGSKSAFFSLFKDDINPFDSYKKLSAIDDIYNALIPGVAKEIIFDSYENTEIDFITRFNTFAKESNYLNDGEFDANHIFFVTVFGHISQAISILMMSLTFRCLPYIRYEVAFKYTMRLSNNFKIPEMKNIVFLSCIAHILHHNFEKEIFKDLTIEQFILHLSTHQPEDRIVQLLKAKGITHENPDLSSIIQSVEEYIEELKK